MKVKNRNRSSLATRAQIKEAFVELMHEKKRISSISVSEIVKKVGINRTTFYTHYNDLYAVVADIESDVGKAVLEKDIDSKEEIPGYLEFVCDTFYENGKEYHMLLSSYESRYYLSRLRKDVCKKLLNVYRKYSDDELIEFKLEMFTDGMAEQLIRFFRSKSRYEFEELKKDLVTCALQLF